MLEISASSKPPVGGLEPLRIKDEKIEDKRLLPPTPPYHPGKY
jgi:hypothetical protein